ncbi:MAG: NusG domain II-containing protein [Lachnospiraceae bacterium]|nr:NusG domain II-containing protein [Lachnospiraceae bacterium]
MLKTRTWIILFAALLTAAAVFWWILGRRSAGSSTVQIIHDGEVIREIDLATVKEPYEFTWEDAVGNRNLIRVEPGRIRVTEANCPDRICVQHGWLSRELTPIVCLPHRLMIQWKEAAP